MSKLATFKCDGCDKLRMKDANHWWSLTVCERGLLLTKFTEDVPADYDYCGEECAQSAVARWMQTGSFEAPSQRPISKPDGA